MLALVAQPGARPGRADDAPAAPTPAASEPAAPAAPAAAAPAPAPAETFAVYPTSIHLSTARDRQRVIVQATSPDGLTRDVTAEAVVSVEHPERAAFEEGRVRPLADGDTSLRVAVGGQSLVVPVHVERVAEDPPVSFKLDVMPVFMRAGCNTGSCHGAARGKDGFRISLFGFDPDGDHHRLTRELSGRRLNLALAEESLLMEKATGAVPHSGGAKIKKGDPYHATLLRWLEAGAANDPGPVPAVVKVEIDPPTAVLDGQGATQRFIVRAKYADGTDRDVTDLAVFSSNNDNSATITQDGTITAQNRGEAFVMARYDTHTVGSHVIVLPKGLVFQWANPAANNYIDAFVNAKLLKLRINPSELCSDEEFIRRVSLDICGTLPTSDELQSFVASTDPAKRANLVDALLERKEFVEMWVMKWSELLMIRTSQQISYKAMLLYYSWLQQQIQSNVPIDQMVRDLLSARGGTFSSAATNYYQNETDTLKVAENVAQVFMGMRIQCAQCHNHPFDRWTMDDYYGFANFFAQIGRKQGEDPRETIVFNSGGGDVRHPVGSRVIAPKFLGGDSPDMAGRDRREVMAAWLTGPENAFFSQNLVNIVWAHFFGPGLINPVDDVRISNPPVNKELLEELSRRFVASKYDFKTLVRDICTSRTYQLSTKTNDTNATDERNFSHALLRRVRAEVLLDMVTGVTETKNKFSGLPLGARAVQIADGNTSTYFLTTFGRATRGTVCSCEVKMEPNLSQALHLLNGETVQGKIQQGGLVKRLLDAGTPPEAIIDEIYRRSLSRLPTEKEKAGLLAIVKEDADPLQALEDGFWAILNSREFVFNH
ncbi:MAG: DUF1549 domain-containing protein [Planctomycetaceae bacterium]